jgi:AcrR family transcriptional regulator
MKRGEAKRQALLRATAALIQEKGIGGTTSREIAERAGTTERTLFKQFGNKEGLMTAVLDMVSKMQITQSGFSQLLTDPPRTLDAFEAWHRALLTERAQSPAVGSEVGRMFLLEIIQSESFKARYSGAWIEGVWAPLVACLDSLKAAGEVDPARPTRLLAQTFISLNLGYLVARTNFAPRLDWDTEADAAGIAALYRRGIAPI